MSAIVVMTHIDVGLTDASPNGSDLWVLNLTTKVKNSNKIMEDAQNKLKVGKLINSYKNDAEKEIAALGIFGLPYAKEEAKKGNKGLINIYKEKYGEEFISIDTKEILDLTETIKNEF